MPSYKVIAPGFFDSKLYSPTGKRPVLYTDKPFKKAEMPSWLIEMPKETTAAKKKREAAAAATATSDAEKSDQDKTDIADASFLGDGESGNSVETL